MNGIGSISLAGVAAAAGSDTASRLIEHQSIGLTAAASIMCTVFVGGLWLERRFTKLEDRLDNLPCQSGKQFPQCDKSEK